MSVHPIEASVFDERSPRKTHFFFSLSRLFGVFPFDDKCETPRSVRVYTVAFVWFVVPVETIMTVRVVHFYYSTSVNSLAVSMMFMTQNILISFFWASHFVSLVLYRRRFETLLVNLCEWSTRNLKFPTYWTWLGLIFFPLYYLNLINLESIGFGDWLPFYYSLRFIKELGIYLTLMQFCTWLEIIEKQLESITQALSETNVLEPLTRRHHQLIVSASHVNDVYSLQLLIICILIFLNFVSWMFYAMQALLVLNSSTHIIVYRLFYCAWQLINVYLIAQTCDKVASKADGFNAELFRIMRESNCLCNNDKLNLYVSMKHSVHFTACGFFTLSYPLITSIISSVTTYLVILVQFNIPTE